MPEPSDSGPVMRLSRWAGAVSGIVGALAVIVTGIWQIGNLLNDLKETRADLTSLRGSFDSYRDKMEQRDEIQAEILVNLRIAVASVQAASVARASVRPTRPTNEDSPVQRAVFTPPQPPPVGTTSTRERLIPDAAALIRNLPRLPAPPTAPTTPSGAVLVSGTTPESRARALEVHENETVDVALQRAMILQDQL